MNILHSHEHKLIFWLTDDYDDVPKNFLNKWKDLKLHCENGDNKDIVDHLKLYCNLDSNKKIPYLLRYEGGMGGDNNIENKQIRFRHQRKVKFKVDHFIVFDQILNTTTESWTYEELDDIIHAFIKMANSIIEAECVEGFIQMRNNNYMT